VKGAENTREPEVTLYEMKEFEVQIRREIVGGNDLRIESHGGVVNGGGDRRRTGGGKEEGERDAD